MIHQNIFLQQIGAENICDNIQHALDRAKHIVEETPTGGALSVGKLPARGTH
jgi:hypothetical protein